MPPNVDSWAFAKGALGVNSNKPETLRIVYCRPLYFPRRSLHL
jgi:hypothetical protein